MTTPVDKTPTGLSETVTAMERSIRFDITVNEDFLLGVAVVLLVMTVVVGLGLLIANNMDNNRDRDVARTEACEDIEHPAERTLCLDR